MTPADWRTLHGWLFRVFPDADARELWAGHVLEARELGVTPPPTDIDTETKGAGTC